jgi:hypothetical protein
LFVLWQLMAECCRQTLHCLKKSWTCQALSQVHFVVEPEFVFKINASAVGQGLSEVKVAPRLTCERREAVTGTRDCGSGLALNLTRASSDGLTTVNAGLSFDRIGGQDRSSAKLQLQMAF